MVLAPGERLDDWSQRAMPPPAEPDAGDTAMPPPAPADAASVRRKPRRTRTTGTAAPDVAAAAVPAPSPDAHAGASLRRDTYRSAERRSLRIFAFDPMTDHEGVATITLDVTNERLAPGPRGRQVAVIDYDATSSRYYPPIDLDQPELLKRGGLAPSEMDPRFHQQMTYAVTMKTIENFEIAMGRPVRFRNNRPLRLFPHAFRGANAYFDPDLNALLFGYFQASRVAPGRNLPGQTVFTCLSHDIVAHETTHAITHRLRRYFNEPSNRDMLAFHEGFADIVAIFQHFTFTDLLRATIQSTRGDIDERTRMIELAGQFGSARGDGEALRAALDPGGRPDPKLYETELEPHDRGRLLLAAVFDAFFMLYERRTRDLLRIATGGTGVLAAGALHPDLVNRLTQEAAKQAQSLLTMCIRAFDYLPPVDITFGDYLRAIVTIDRELVAVDELGQRAALIEAFRRRGIYPDGVPSLSTDAIAWEDRRDPRLPKVPIEQLMRVQTSWREPLDDAPLSGDDASDGAAQEGRANAASIFHGWAKQNAALLDLDQGRPIAVGGFHSGYRVARNGGLLREIVVQFVQQDKAAEQTAEFGVQFGGVPLRGGTTVVASTDGDVRYIISKPLMHTQLRDEQKQAAAQRQKLRLAYVQACDDQDPHMAWMDEAAYGNRMAARASFRALHGGRRGG